MKISKALSCLAVVLKLFCISSSVPRGVNGCTDDGLVLTSSISGRNACPSEEVTFTCTAQTTAVFWGNEEFGEKTMHYTSAPSTMRDNFRAEIVSYDRNQSCLVSSLSFHATASRNGTTVTCTSRDRSSSQSLLLHTVSHITLDHLTVAPVSPSTVLLEWKVIPTDGHHCITSYNIQVSGPNESQWGAQIPGGNQLFYVTGLQLIPPQEYTYCVNANLLRGQIDLKLSVNFTELQEPHPPANLSAEMRCNQGYEIQIDWQSPLPKLLGLPVTGYLLQYHVYDHTSIIELPALNTSYTLDSVPSGAVYTITVSALSDVGPSENNPSVQLAVPSLFCEVAAPEGTTYVTVAALTSGLVVFSCVVLFATTCLCYHVINRRKRTLKKEDQVSKQAATVSQKKEKSPEYEEIFLQNHPQFHIVKNIAYALNEYH